MEDAGDLTDRQRRYVEGLARGIDSRAAAKGAGYSDSYAKVAAHRLKKKPAVAKALEAIRSDARREVVYDVQEAVKEIDKAILFGYGSKNPMSVAKLLELKSKLFGLLVDRYQELPVDLKGALAEARGRVINVMPPRAHNSLSAVQVLTSPQPAVADPAMMSLSVDGAPKWTPFSGD